MARRKKGLSQEDIEVWQQVVTRVKRKSIAKPQKIFPETVKKSELKSTAVHLRPFSVGEKAILKTKDRSPSFEDDVRSTSPNMDRKNFQRLVKGKLDIDGALDLHGLTADQAQVRLIAYITQSHAMGLRLLLVITGKGKHERLDEFNRSRGGILRQSLPDWLRGPNMSSKVLQVTQAQPKHGGAGAFYVYLRRSRQQSKFDR